MNQKLVFVLLNRLGLRLFFVETVLQLVEQVDRQPLGSKIDALDVTKAILRKGFSQKILPI